MRTPQYCTAFTVELLRSSGKLKLWPPLVGQPVADQVKVFGRPPLWKSNGRRTTASRRGVVDELDRTVGIVHAFVVAVLVHVGPEPTCAGPVGENHFHLFRLSVSITPETAVMMVGRESELRDGIRGAAVIDRRRKLHRRRPGTVQWQVVHRWHVVVLTWRPTEYSRVLLLVVDS